MTGPMSGHPGLLAEVTGRRRTLLWMAVLAGLLLAMLDQTIVGTALPRLVGELGGGPWYVWIFTSYLVPATVLLPVAARLSDRYGRRQVLLVGMTLFVLGSALCSVAQSTAQVTAFRGVQGTGAAALEALSFLLVTELAGPARSAIAQAALAIVMAFSFVAGPLIGGVLTDHVGWRWVFLVNVPIGVAAITLVARVLPAQVGKVESRETPVDVLGIVTLTSSVAAVLVGVNQHTVVGSWLHPRTAGLLTAGALGLAAFVFVERRAVAPLVPLRLLTDPVTGRLLAAGATATFGLYACMLVIPRYFQQAEHASATTSGLMVYPLLIGMLVSVNVGASTIVRRGACRGTLLWANALVLVGAVGFATLGRSATSVEILVLMALIGLGVGPALSGIQIGLGRSTSPRDIGAAMGTLLLLRQVGGVFALSASEALYTGRLGVTGSPTEAVGRSIFVVAAAGAVIAGLAMFRLRVTPVTPAAQAGERVAVSRAG